MLQLALVALLAGAPLNAAPAETPNGDDKAPRTEASVGIFKAEVANDEAIVNDTYSFGRAEPTFVKFWVGYGWGRDNEFYGPGGNVIGLNAATGGEFSEVTVQRAFVGAQVDFLNFPAFRAGVGAQLMTGQNTFTSATGGADVGSDFGLQNAKFFAHARGRAVGLHGGYILDLAPDPSASLPAAATGTDNRDALFVGADFDYPSRAFRLFGGVDYFMINDAAGDINFAAEENLLVFNMGGGVRLWILEVGAAALIRADVGSIGAGHQGSVAPYVRISPPQIPVSIAVRGAVTDEYADYGYALGGASKPVTHTGFTVAATIGF